MNQQTWKFSFIDFFIYIFFYFRNLWQAKVWSCAKKYSKKLSKKVPLLQYLNAWWKFPSWSLNKSGTASLRPSNATLLRYLIQISVRCSTMLSRKSIHFRSHFYQQLHVMASSYTFAGFLGRRRFLSFFVDIKSKFLGSWHVDLIRVDHFETNHLETNL